MRFTYCRIHIEGMVESLMGQLRKAGVYVLIGCATVALPSALEVSGASRAIAKRELELQRADLVYKLDTPAAYYSREDVQRNIEYISKYEHARENTARFGVNAFACLMGLAGAGLAIAAKRKLDGIV